MTNPMNRPTDHHRSTHAEASAKDSSARVPTTVRLRKSHDEAAAHSSKQRSASKTEQPLPKQPPAALPAGRPSDGPVRGLMSGLGHTAACVEQSLGGTARGSGCACGCPTRSMNDPAVAVALALQFAKQRKRTGIPIPRSVVRLLAQRVDEGNGACLAVAQSLHRQGLVTSLGGMCDPLLAHGLERGCLNAEGMQ
jgi:hypothetical protein